MLMMTATPPDRPEKKPLLVTAAEVALMLGVQTRTVNRWHDEEVLPPPVKMPGYRRWRRRDIEIWVEAGCSRKGWRRRKG